MSNFPSLETRDTESLCRSDHSTDERTRSRKSTGHLRVAASRGGKGRQINADHNDRLQFPWWGQNSRFGLQTMISSSQHDGMRKTKSYQTNDPSFADAHCYPMPAHNPQRHQDHPTPVLPSSHWGRMDMCELELAISECKPQGEACQVGKGD